MREWVHWDYLNNERDYKTNAGSQKTSIANSIAAREAGHISFLWLKFNPTTRVDSKSARFAIWYVCIVVLYPK